MQLVSAEPTALVARLNLRKASLAALTAVGLMLTASQASAVIVFSGAVNLAIPTSTNGLYLNVVTGANNLPPPGSAGITVPGWDINPYGSAGLSFFSAVPAASSGYAGAGGNVSNLAVGTPIGGSSTFITAINTPPVAGWNLNSTNNYVGFRFLNEAGGTVHYGWMQLGLGATTTTGRTLVSYAFESTPLTAIPAGVVPEPGTYALMGLGLAGLFVAARRRQQG